MIKTAVNITSLPKYMSDRKSEVGIAERAGRSADVIKILTQTIEEIERVSPEDLLKDLEHLKTNVIPINNHHSKEGNDNRVSALLYCFEKLIQTKTMAKNEQSLIEAMNDGVRCILDVEKYLKSIGESEYIPPLYIEVYTYTSAEFFKTYFPESYHANFNFQEIRVLENIGIALGVFTPTPDLLHWDKEFPLKRCCSSTELPIFADKTLNQITEERAIFNDLMIKKLMLAINSTREGYLRCLLAMKLGVFYFQIGQDDDAWNVLIDAGNKLLKMKRKVRAYYCLVFAYHCTDIERRKMRVLLHLLVLGKLNSEEKTWMMQNFIINNHPLLEYEEVVKRVKERMTAVSGEKIDGENLISVGVHPSVLTLEIGIPLNCVIDGKNYNFEPHVPVKFTLKSTKVLIEIVKGPTLVVPIRQMDRYSLVPVSVECVLPEFIKVDKEWKGFVGLKLTVNSAVNLVQAKGKFFTKTAQVGYNFKSQTEKYEGKIQMKHRKIDTSLFKAPYEIMFYMPIHGLSRENPASPFTIKCSGVYPVTYNGFVSVIDPIITPLTVHLENCEGNWVGKFPLTNNTQNTITVKNLVVTINKDLCLKEVNPIQVDKAKNLLVEVQGGRVGSGEVALEFEHNGNVYEYHNPITFIKEKVYCSVKFEFDEPIINVGGVMNVFTHLRGIEDHHEIEVLIESSEAICVCGFVRKIVHVDPKNDSVIHFQVMGIVAGMAQPPVLKFRVNGKDVLVEYKNALPEIVVRELHPIIGMTTK
ncbi:hypothetical protein EIN_043500 [Entamoeba invadens IP1]|uniref:Uncharacterized protein n=1 Tax=Entamoeba invadens IP1 TaxID=370355 RepID=A0A0A1TZ45_ENTIV|nr:hypothetical protein EIN_043500 [Entamoeba invadens IP1]ELP86832.1 hypothetical protein EIN_043500 [Entamoeba invadens IP1]|eukprot:XP_004253603.1 hypothetical protein EIN_043500 [Entamoeba invadens IP1]